MVEINEKKCTGCGLCAFDCSRKTIEIIDLKAQVKKPTCSECGHCVAICLQGAISMPQYNEKEIIPCNKVDFNLDAEGFLFMQKFRRSIRHFKDSPVEPEKIKKIIEAGRYSPTGGNSQTNHFIVLQKKIDAIRDIAIRTLSETASDSSYDMGGSEIYRRTWLKMYDEYKTLSTDKLFFNAPCVIIITSSDKSGNAGVNGGIAASRMELTANSMGLGICYLGFLRRAIEFNPNIKSLLKIEDGEQFVVAFVVGYPQVKYLRTVNRKPADVRFI